MDKLNALSFTKENDILFPFLSTDGRTHSFAIVADPQLPGHEEYVGNWAQHPKLEYRNYYRAIRKINRLKPDFVVILGDFVAKPTITPQYQNFIRMTELFDIPVVLVHGNHDGRFPFSQFFNAQDTLSGFQSLHYSFDVGQWHYVVLPSIYDEYDSEQLLKWLAKDMKANQHRDTIVFSHYPYLPQGLTQLEYYAQNPIGLRKAIMDEVLNYGNTKYWFAGHVHNGLKTSVKISWEYRGATFVTVPTNVVPRNYGEEFPIFNRGMDQGGYFMTVDVKPTGVTLIGRRGNQPQTFTYPERFQPFRDGIEPRWFTRIPMFDPKPFRNGSFERGLRHWYSVWRYKTDRQPGFITRRSKTHVSEGRNALMLAVREKGSDWAQDELTEVYQVVDVQPNRHPVLSLDYYIKKLSKVSGGYLRIHAFKDSAHQGSMLFYFGHDGNNRPLSRTAAVFHLTATGKAETLRAFQKFTAQKEMMFWELQRSPGQWHHLKVDIQQLFQKGARLQGQPQRFNVDKMFIALGTWTSDQPNSRTQIFFDDVDLKWKRRTVVSKHDGQRLAITRDIYEPRFLGLKYRHRDSKPLTVASQNALRKNTLTHRQVGCADDDLLRGDARHDAMRGRRGDDILHGRGGNDELLGNAGDDRLVGGSGDDWLNGYGRDGDRDRLSGGRGADVFVLGDETSVFYQGSGTAIIMDFESRAGDKILLHGSATHYHLTTDNVLGRLTPDTLIHYGSTLVGIIRDQPKNTLSFFDFAFI
jgi:3',5'-cyclic AMP phosphodiesterase CpdA